MKIGYSLFICISLGVMIPLKANAAASCTLLPGNHAVFDRSGKVIGKISGPKEVDIEQKISEKGEGSIAEYRINVKGGFYTVYRLDGSNQYIDISSCKGTSQTL